MDSLRVKYAENTRQALLDTALMLFAERNYAELSAEELVRTAGLTRGALYHHFDGKRGLFEATFEYLESQAAQRIKAAIESASDPMERVDHGVSVFLEICADDTYRHIVLGQGPIALGWRRWREIDQQHLGTVLLDSVTDLLARSAMKPYAAELIASAFYGALTELSLTIAEAEDPDRSRAQARSLVLDLLGGLAE